MCRQALRPTGSLEFHLALRNFSHPPIRFPQISWRCQWVGDGTSVPSDTNRDGATREDRAPSSDGFEAVTDEFSSPACMKNSVSEVSFEVRGRDLWSNLIQFRHRTDTFETGFGRFQKPFGASENRIEAAWPRVAVCNPANYDPVGKDRGATCDGRSPMCVKAGRAEFSSRCDGAGEHRVEHLIEFGLPDECLGKLSLGIGTLSVRQDATAQLGSEFLNVIVKRKHRDLLHLKDTCFAAWRSGSGRGRLLAPLRGAWGSRLCRAKQKTGAPLRALCDRQNRGHRASLRRPGPPWDNQTPREYPCRIRARCPNAAIHGAANERCARGKARQSKPPGLIANLRTESRHRPERYWCWWTPPAWRG